MLKGVLEDRGFVVSAFADAASVLAALQSGIEPRLVLLGWRLQGASGLDLLRALRERGCRVPVVFLTGRFLAERKEALKGGAEDLVNKTVAIDTLMQRLERLLA